MCEEKHLEMLISYLVDLEVWRFWMTFCCWTFLGLLSVFSSISYCSYLLKIPLCSCKASWDWRQHGYFSNLTPEKSLIAIVFILLTANKKHTQKYLFFRRGLWTSLILRSGFSPESLLYLVSWLHINQSFATFKAGVIDLYSTIEDAMGSFYSVKCLAPTLTRTRCPCPAVPSQLI